MTMLNVNGLTKRYGEGKGIFDFDLTLKEKDILLLLGPNGAGKTTAMRSLLGLVDTDAGSIVFNDMDTSQHPVEFLSSTGAVVSTPAYYEYMTGYENLKLYSRFYDHVNHDRIVEVMDIVGLAVDMDTKVAEYSTGMKQLLDFGRAVLHEPELLILDEPFNGMDIERKAALKDYMKGLVKFDNISIIISSHMAGDLETFADRVVILYEGKSLYDGPMTYALEDHDSLEAFYLEVIENYTNAKKGEK